MEAAQINFEEPPALRWQSVINEAEKQNTMTRLVPVLLARYPNNPQLRAACEPFEASDPVKATPQTLPTQVLPPGSVLVQKFKATPAATDPAAQVLKVAQGRTPPAQPVEQTVPPEQPADPQHTDRPTDSGPDLADMINMSNDELIATVISLRITAAESELRLQRLESWRRRLSVMNSADLAAMKDE